MQLKDDTVLHDTQEKILDAIRSMYVLEGNETKDDMDSAILTVLCAMLCVNVVGMGIPLNELMGNVFETYNRYASTPELVVGQERAIEIPQTQSLN